MTKVVTGLWAGSAGDVAAQAGRAIQDRLPGKASLVVVFASPAIPLGELLPALDRQLGGVPLIGCTTAGEFIESRDAKQSASVFAIAGDYKVYTGLGTGLKENPADALKQALTGVPASMKEYPHRTAVMLLDPLSGNGEETTLLASMVLGPETTLAGGAAGDDLQMKTTHVGVGGRVASDAVAMAVIFSKVPFGVGVHHGHEPISSPFKVTRAEGNVVYEVDGRPAWDVWVEKTSERAAQQGINTATLKSDSEIGGFFLAYEAGLQAGQTYKIRAPLVKRPDGGIQFACGIPEGSTIRITESIPARQIDSAREAAKRSRIPLGNRKVAGALVFDCICRNLILKDQFGQAVKEISRALDGAPLAGFETYGEIALKAGDYSGFHNTTTVVLAFPEA